MVSRTESSARSLVWVLLLAVTGGAVWRGVELSSESNDYRQLPTCSVPLLDERRRGRVYHRRDTHWSARGNRVAGERLAAYLAALLDR